MKSRRGELTGTRSGDRHAYPHIRGGRLRTLGKLLAHLTQHFTIQAFETPLDGTLDPQECGAPMIKKQQQSAQQQQSPQLAQQ